MFFIASKVIGFFAQPSNLLASIGVLGALLAGLGHQTAGLRMLAGAMLLLVIAGLSPLPNIVLLPLEDRFAQPVKDDRPVTGVVILGGASDPAVAALRPNSALNEAAERMTVVAELMREHPQARFLFSGGSGLLFPDGPTEADTALRMFRSFGLATDRLILEDRSRNTAENAVFSARLAQPKPGERWLLVTSAYHMPRAIGCFRQAGFQVEAYPVDFRTRGWEDATRPFATLGKGLQRLDIGVREWIGLVAYWGTGRIPELFPAP